jgi:hypothetical protein
LGRIKEAAEPPPQQEAARTAGGMTRRARAVPSSTARLNCIATINSLSWAW